jgi:hypothetical protein
VTDQAIDALELPLDATSIEKKQAEPNHAIARQDKNLICHVPSGKYFARFRACGKLIRDGPQTGENIAKLRLADSRKGEKSRQKGPLVQNRP